MIFFVLGLFIILFSKEYIVINSELIIYLTFLSITVLFVNMFSFLKNTFNSIRITEQEALNASSLNLKQELINVQIMLI